MNIDSKPGYHKPSNLIEVIEQANIGATAREIKATDALEQIHMKVVEINVHDKATWETEQSAEILLPFFGELAAQAYASRDEKRALDLNDPETRAEAIANIAEGDLSIADTVYAVMDGDHVVGFLVAEEVELPDAKNTCNLSIVVTHDGYRNRGIGKELERYLFSSEKYDVVTGCSSTPGAVKMRLEMGGQHGYTTYFCGFRNGQFGDAGTPEQHKRVERIGAEVTRSYVECGTTIPAKQIPKNFVIIHEDIGGLPPVRREDIHFGDDDARLQETFEKALLPLQEKKLPHTVHGVLVSIKE